MHILLQWDESWRVGGTNTGPSVFDGFVSDTEFTQIVSNHFRLQRREKSNVSQVGKIKQVGKISWIRTIGNSGNEKIQKSSKL